MAPGLTWTAPGGIWYFKRLYDGDLIFQEAVSKFNIPVEALNSFLIELREWSRHSVHFPNQGSLRPELSDVSKVLTVYHDLSNVFCKAQAQSLPAHYPLVCVIQILPGCQPPKGNICPLCSPEREAIDQCLQETLQAGIILPFSSPQGLFFFLLANVRGDCALAPITGVWTIFLWAIPTPHPLLQTAFDLVKGAMIFI